MQKKAQQEDRLPAKLDAIFFDIDDTLFSTSVFAEKARRSAVEAMIQTGLQGDKERILKELGEVVEEFSSNYGQHFDKLLLRLPAESLANHNPALLVASGMVAYHDTKFREFKVYDDVYEVLKALADLKLTRGIISAGLRVKQAEKIIRLHIHEFLTPGAIFITDQVGISKPNPKLYQHVLESMELDPKRTMYVGDHPENDVDPCNSLGMITVWNRRSGRHSQKQGKSKPDYEIRDFYDLRSILREDFDLAL
jgi:putative hydrolase of the HAD superfamily